MILHTQFIEIIQFALCSFYVYNMCMAPTIFIFESLKFNINANDHPPPHVHVEGKGASVRINLVSLDFMDDETDFSRPYLLVYTLRFNYGPVLPPPSISVLPTKTIPHPLTLIKL